jgi:acyl-CoA synthetase (AMP-forming)/AMP-acid ligase II
MASCHSRLAHSAIGLAWGGENIYCAEVQNALMDHPDVAEAALIGRADDRWGEIAVAVLTLRDNQIVGIGTLPNFSVPGSLGSSLRRMS